LIPGLELVPVPDADSCCGSAGIYNIEQPDLAREIGDRKVNALLETGADLVVSGNIGCIMQLQSRLREGGRKLPVLHTVEVLDLAYRGLLGNVRAGAGSGAQGVQSGD
jgi:glycolate oxidase iron-sulfur subunit